MRNRLVIGLAACTLLGAACHAADTSALTRQDARRPLALKMDRPAREEITLVRTVSHQRLALLNITSLDRDAGAITRVAARKSSALQALSPDADTLSLLVAPSIGKSSLTRTDIAPEQLHALTLTVNKARFMPSLTVPEANVSLKTDGTAKE